MKAQSFERTVALYILLAWLVWYACLRSLYLAISKSCAAVNATRQSCFQYWSKSHRRRAEKLRIDIASFAHAAKQFASDENTDVAEPVIFRFGYAVALLFRWFEHTLRRFVQASEHRVIVLDGAVGPWVQWLFRTSLRRAQAEQEAIHERTATLNWLLEHDDDRLVRYEVFIWMIAPSRHAWVTMGDFSEVYFEKIARKGEAAARQWARWQIFREARLRLMPFVRLLTQIIAIWHWIKRHFHK